MPVTIWVEATPSATRPAVISVLARRTKRGAAQRAGRRVSWWCLREAAQARPNTGIGGDGCSSKQGRFAAAGQRRLLSLQNGLRCHLISCPSPYLSCCCRLFYGVNGALLEDTAGAIQVVQQSQVLQRSAAAARVWWTRPWSGRR